MNDYLFKALTCLAIIAIFYILFGAYQYNFVKQHFSKTAAGKALTKYIRSVSIVLALYVSIFIALPLLLTLDRTIYNILDRALPFIIATIVWLFFYIKFASSKLAITEIALYREYQPKWIRKFSLWLSLLLLFLTIAYFANFIYFIKFDIDKAVSALCTAVVFFLSTINHILLCSLPQLQFTDFAMTCGVSITSWREIRAYKWGKKIEDIFSTSERISLYLLTKKRIQFIFISQLVIPQDKQEEVDIILRQYITENDRL